MALNWIFTFGYFFSYAALIALKAASDESALDTAIFSVPEGVPPEEEEEPDELEQPARTATTAIADSAASPRRGVSRGRNVIVAMFELLWSITETFR
jgi:hypothetical protein